MPSKVSSTGKPKLSPDNPVIGFADRAAFASWLRREHASSPGIWLKLAKKGSGGSTLTYAEAVEVALIWGWIDGQKQKFDDAAWLQRFVPRRPQSVWSKINRDKALALIEAGAMEPPGLAEVERARADGRWERAYDPPSKAAVPDDLAAALAGSKPALALFAKLDSANRYAILYRIQALKRPESRARRIAEFVAMLARGETLHPMRTGEPQRKRARPTDV